MRAEDGGNKFSEKKKNICSFLEAAEYMYINFN